MIRSNFFLLCLICLCSCADKSTTSQTTAQVETASPVHAASEAAIQWEKLYDLAEQETISYYQKKEHAVNSDHENLNAVQFVGLLLENPEEGVIRTIEDADASRLQLEAGAQVVIVREEKIPDDSIFGEVRFFKLRKQSLKWEIAEVSSAWACYPGRGHQDYSTIPCH